MGKQKVLIVEDEPDLSEALEYTLQREGFETLAANDGRTAIVLAIDEQPDVILLDIMLPDIQGTEVCRRLMSDPRTRGIHVLMVSSRDDESDVVLGLGLGADDYITKPYSPKELTARIRAALRRGSLNRQVDEAISEVIKLGEIIIDPARHELIIGQRRSDLTATELKLLHYLAANPGRIFSRHHLLTRVMGKTTATTERTIDVHIRSLRKKLEPHDDLIETIRGVGYRCREQKS